MQFFAKHLRQKYIHLLKIRDQFSNQFYQIVLYSLFKIIFSRYNVYANKTFGICNILYIN